MRSAPILGENCEAITFPTLALMRRREPRNEKEADAKAETWGSQN